MDAALCQVHILAVIQFVGTLGVSPHTCSFLTDSRPGVTWLTLLSQFQQSVGRGRREEILDALCQLVAEVFEAHKHEYLHLQRLEKETLSVKVSEDGCS